MKQQNSLESNSAACLWESPVSWLYHIHQGCRKRTGHSRRKRLTESNGNEKSKATGQLVLGLKRNSPFVEAGWGLWRSHYFFHHLSCEPSTQEWIQWYHVPLSSERILPFPRRGRKRTRGNYTMQITQISWVESITFSAYLGNYGDVSTSWQKGLTKTGLPLWKSFSPVMSRTSWDRWQILCLFVSKFQDTSKFQQQERILALSWAGHTLWHSP